MNEIKGQTYLQGVNQYTIKLGLETIHKLLEILGSPQTELKCIHITGTNGKGSTLAFVNHMLMAAGYKVGLYTSPALERFNERLQVSGKPIDETELSEVTEVVKRAAQEMVQQGFNEPTEFELVTAMAFVYFKRQKVDVVLLEVGMGGRLDATNVLDHALVSVITPIALDHTDFLGDTLAKIAYEKAGIIKRGTRVVIHPQEDEAMAVIERVCEETEVPLFIAPADQIEIISQTAEGTIFKLGGQSYEIAMLGAHQTRNAAVALSVIEAINASSAFFIGSEAIRKGLKTAQWHGRLEIMSHEPLVLIDGAHNLHGAKGLAETLRNLFSTKKIIAILGILGDKDVSGVLAELMPFVDVVICTEPDNPRKMDGEKLVKMVSEYGVVTYLERDLEKAFDLALELESSALSTTGAKRNDPMILGFGSLYLIGQLRGIILKAVKSGNRK